MQPFLLSPTELGHVTSGRGGADSWVDFDVALFTSMKDR